MPVSVHVNGSKIREARLSAGMTQAQLARAIKSTERNVIRWENDQNQPRVMSVAAIAEATGHSIDFFLTGSSEADDEDEAAALTLDEYLRVRVRQILRAEPELIREILAELESER
jgi:transcriptional regulator with XRE-family HTH domain